MAIGGENGIVLAQVLIDRFGLCRRFNDNDGHYLAFEKLGRGSYRDQFGPASLLNRTWLPKPARKCNFGVRIAIFGMSIPGKNSDVSARSGRNKITKGKTSGRFPAHIHGTVSYRIVSSEGRAPPQGGQACRRVPFQEAPPRPFVPARRFR